MERHIEKLLPHVQVPVRYTGGEINVCRKPHGDARVKFALCYPDLYEVGMSSLGIRIIYGLLNEIDGVVCERVFCPEKDMEDLLKKNKNPLFTLESKEPVKNFDVLGFSVSSELNYTNVLNVLELSEIPVLRSERKEGDPLVIAGGNCIFNFAPLSAFIDCFAVGEGEEVIPEITEVLKEKKGGKREDIIAALSKIEGVYAPAFPAETVKKRFVKNFDASFFPVKWLVPLTEVIHDRISLEIMRGCGQGCFFCQAGSCWRPVRTRSVETLAEIARQAYKNTGYEEFSLLSFSSGDHPEIERIFEKLLRDFAGRKVTLSFPSIRIDTFSFELAARTKEIKKTALTFAPETGESLRFRIGKKIKDGELTELARKARAGGWRQIKLYFMLGLPGEEDSDILDAARLINELSKILSVKAAFNTFIPKPHTVFERRRFITAEEYLFKKRLLVENVWRNRHIRLTFHPYEMSRTETLLGRGDESLCAVIKRVREKGGMRENWDEHFRPSVWEESFREENMDVSAYLGELKQDVLPWHKINIKMTSSI
ncbi:MAG: TIGR03960 family B12-binding radical SAM protein [Candidatus Omnitrophica bacterium]|nr:TIGR03960 family B12-binding radical SAM protein [Candidatus Omnitrophota bacterium]